MIELKNINKSYVTKSGYVTNALRDLSVTLPSRGLVFILGRSGSGKSTLLNVLGGIDTPDSGEMIIDGKSNNDFTREDYDSYRNSYVGFVFQEYNLIPEYSVGENVALALELQGKRNDRSVIDEALRRVELIDAGENTLYDRKTNELSGGQKQRVAVARALVKEPKMILADEPTGALDSKTGEQLFELLKKLSEDKLVVVVTHDRENAEKYGDRIIKIADGRIVADEERSKAEPESPREYSAVKSHLPFARTVTMGVNGLKAKKFRLITSILISVIAVSIFGFALTAGLTDPLEVELRTLYDREMHTVTLSTLRTDADGISAAVEPNSEQYKKILEYNGGKEPVKLIRASSLSGIGEMEDYVADEDARFYSGNPYYGIGLSDFTYFAEVDPETGAADARLVPDDRFENTELCRLPGTYNEIAITDIRASMFLRFGYLGADGMSKEIERLDDLIGLKLGNFTVCGVYSTEQDRGFYEKYADRQNIAHESDAFFKQAYGAQSSIMSFGFLAAGFSENAGVKTTASMLVMSGDVGRDCGFIRSLTCEADGYEYMATISSAVTPLTSFVSEFRKNLLTPFLIIAASFSLFSVLLTMSFLTVIFDFKKRELGILRALGARSKDILGICLTESSLIAVVEYAISMLCVCVGCLIINLVNSASLLFAGAPVVFAMLGLCLGVSALATVVPVVRLMRKKPIDIINNK